MSKESFYDWLAGVDGYHTAKKVIPIVTEILKQSPCQGEVRHGLSVAEIVLAASGSLHHSKFVEPLVIAAYAHDIERGYEPEHALTKEMYLGDYEAYKRAHAWRSAAVITKILKDVESPQWLVKKVREIVVLHEDGGGIEANLVCDADSISFMKDNLREFASTRTPEFVQQKLDWMYNRIRNPGIKEKYLPLYQDCCQWIGEYFNPEAE